MNYWIYRRHKRQTCRKINSLLLKFVGQKVRPIDVLFAKMRDLVFQYFLDHDEELKYFGNEDPFDYAFEIEEQAGYVTNVIFQP